MVRRFWKKGGPGEGDHEQLQQRPLLLDEDSGVELWRYRSDFILQGITASPAVEGRQLVFVTNAGWIQSMVSP